MKILEVGKDGKPRAYEFTPAEGIVIDLVQRLVWAMETGEQYESGRVVKGRQVVKMLEDMGDLENGRELDTLLAWHPFRDYLCEIV